MHHTRLALLILLLGPMAAAGQDPRSGRTLPGSGTSSDSLPRELVSALLGMRMGGAEAADIRVDLPGDGLPDGLLAGARVLGSAVLGPTTTTVAYMPGTPAAVFDTIRSRLEAAEWQSAPRPRDERGFVTASPLDPSNRFCRGSEVLTPTISVRRLDRSLLILTHQRAPGLMMCAETPVRSARDMLADTPLPALLPPAGTRSTGGGASGGNDGWQIRTYLTGSIPLVDLLRHYERLLVAANWTKLEEMTSRGLVVAAFSYGSGTGEQWYCAFLASRSPNATDTSLTLQLRRM